MSNCRSKFVSATSFYFLKHGLLSLNGNTYIGNGSTIEFSSNTLLTEDLIAIQYTRYLVLHIFTSSFDFSNIKHSMEPALLSLVLQFKIKNQYNRPYH